MSTVFPNTWPMPESRVHHGRFVSLAPSDPDVDAAELFAAGHDSAEARALWRFLAAGPFADLAAMRDWMRTWCGAPDVVAFTVTDRDLARRVGMISIMRITRAHGVAELGCIWYAPAAQRTKVNTECLYLLLRHLFDDLGYRRVEWKCNQRNERSRAAALRLGFRFEGTFRQHMVIKGLNRDTDWFAMLDSEWPQRKTNLERWLYTDDSVPLSQLNAPENDDASARCRA